MGILPLQFQADENVNTYGLTGEETYSVPGLATMLEKRFAEGKQITVQATRADGTRISIAATVRIDTPQEILYYQHGGILQYVLRTLAARA